MGLFLVVFSRYWWLCWPWCGFLAGWRRQPQNNHELQLLPVASTYRTSLLNIGNETAIGRAMRFDGSRLSHREYHWWLKLRSILYLDWYILSHRTGDPRTKCIYFLAELPQATLLRSWPGFILQNLAVCESAHAVEFPYIQPGKPAQNTYIERFNRTFREAVLDTQVFATLHRLGKSLKNRSRNIVLSTQTKLYRTGHLINNFRICPIVPVSCGMKCGVLTQQLPLLPDRS